MLDQLEIIDCEQNSDEWHEARCGIVTASEVDAVMDSGKGGAPSKTRRAYMLKLIGERMTGKVIQTWAGNADTERGHAMEPDLVKLYAMAHDVQPEVVGFMRRGRFGASPDRKISTNGLLEGKSKAPHILLDLLERDVFPAEHVKQCQSQLAVSGREWVDLVCYWPGLPLFVKRAYRDEALIAEINVAVREFTEELDALQAKITKLYN